MSYSTMTLTETVDYLAEELDLERVKRPAGRKGSRNTT